MHSRNHQILIFSSHDNNAKSSMTYRKLTKRLTLTMLPPATPPFIPSTSKPCLLTSNDHITIVLGGETKFL